MSAPVYSLLCQRTEVGLCRPSSLHRPSLLVSRLSSVRRPSPAFTLLEVMLVLAIIAILAGLLYPVIIGARSRALEKQAMAETRTILVAIKAYRHEYGKWPGQIQATQDTTYITNNWIVIQPLLGFNTNRPGSAKGLNPKEKIFLPMQVDTNNNPDYAGNYLDPWGIPYVICMDENGDGKLMIATNPVSYVSSNTSGRAIGETNIQIYITLNSVLTNYDVSADAAVDVVVASMGGSSNDLTKFKKFSSWADMQ